MLTRREILLRAGALCVPAVAHASRLTTLKIGVMSGLLRQKSELEAVGAAKRLGFDAIQLTLGQDPGDGHLPLSADNVQRALLDESRKQELPFDATYLNILHTNCLKNNPLAPRWVSDGIRITRALNARILMIVFFGKCAMLNRQEQDAVAGALKELAPEAEKSKVILGFENLLSAEDNARVLDLVNSPALKVYYDVGNSTFQGFDVPKEIRWLGRDRICQFHIKDKGYLGEGTVKVPEILRAISDIRFEGYANLETGSPSKDYDADLRRNLAFVRRTMSEL